MLFWERVAGILFSTKHVSNLRLLRVEGKAVRDAGLGIIEFQGELVEFVAAIGSGGFAAIAKCGHLHRLHRREVLGNAQVLVQDLEA
ncbi:MAG TPA: hypothetical protein VOA41_15875, partial [Candidatus Dormibacteraeota bacterium]|nr:hypothetical protein [Candidatus Dormibacteraeota bacterium]